MSPKKISRREFLYAATTTAAGAALAACQPQTVIVEREVEKVVKETVEVEKEKVVEKEVTKVIQKEVTKVVEKEKVVTATPVPPSQYGEAPRWGGLVAQGKLPPIDERIPSDPRIIVPVEEVGEYGGTWHRLATSQGDVGIYRSRLTYENPVRWNEDGSDMLPNIAHSWEVSDDGKEFTFYLRKGIRWTDGEPYTAEDWVFLFVDHWGNEERQPNFPSTWSSGGEPAVCEAIDDYTARLTFAVPYGLCMLKLASSWGADYSRYPAHYMKQFHPAYTDKAKVEQAAKDAGHEFWYQLYNNMTNPLNNDQVPTIYSWDSLVLPPKVPVVLDRNPYYWKVDTEGNQLPYIDRVEFVIVAGAEQINLRAAQGEVDMQLRHIIFDNFPIFQDSKEQGDYRVLLWNQGMATDAVLAINQTNQDDVLREIVQDKRFRYACSLGMNRDEIIQSVYLGMAEPSQVGPIASSPFYWEEYSKAMIEYDPDQANAYLDEMGLTEKDADGYRLRPDGKRLSIVYEYAPVFGAWGSIGVLLTAQWKKIGIELIPKEEARQLMYERKAANEHDMGIWTGSAEFNPLIDPRWFIPFSGESIHAGQYAAWWNTGGKEGIEPTGDIRTVLEIYDEIKVTVDDAKQKELFRQILELNKENLWVLGIATAPPQIVIVKNAFRNVPEVSVSDWHLQTPGSTAVEQYFIRQ
jgi:peptide/nickel transport system substrate-binding protein